MILNKKKFTDNNILLTNLIFSFFPISFILGSFVVNLNLILFCCLGIFHLNTEIFKTKFILSIKIIFLFFLVIFISTSLSFLKSLYFDGYDYVNLTRLFKSIFFFRFFLMLIIIYFLTELNILHFKYFFLSSIFSSILISLDIIYQYSFGHNLIGLENIPPYNSGFFGDELMAGGFIQRFSFFSIFFVAFMFKNNNKTRFILTTITICICGVGILLAGNRTPLILFLLGLFSIFLFNNNIRKILPISLLVLMTILGFFYSSDEKINANYKSLHSNVKGAIIKSLNTIKNNKKNDSEQQAREKRGRDVMIHQNVLGSGHMMLYQAALKTWGQNKVIGNGIKSFRIDCKKFIVKEVYPIFSITRGVCSNHPHNYFLEILTETGIVGLFLTIIIGLAFIVYLFKNFMLFKGNNAGEIILLSATISLFLELFPLRSTGSLFTTNTATYTILVASIILCHKKLMEVENF